MMSLRKTASCKAAFAVSLILCMTVLQGCGIGAKRPAWLPKLTPCKLTLTQEGKPLANANINLVSPPGNPPLEWMIIGCTDAQGIVYPAVQVFKGVPQGEYVIVVEKTENEYTNNMNHPVNEYWVIDSKYGSAATSTLKLTVGDSPVDQTFDLGKPVRIMRK